MKNVPKAINKGVISDEDYIANYNFGEVYDDQDIQQAIEQSIKEQSKINKK